MIEDAKFKEPPAEASLLFHETSFLMFKESSLTIRTCAALLLLLASVPWIGKAEEITLGAVLGLSGAAAVWSDNARAGIELAISEINSQGGVGGKNLKVVFEDSRTTASGATTSFQKLVGQDKVKIVIGDVWAFLTVPMIPLAEKHQVVLISPTVMDKSIPNPNQYFFSMGHRFESLKAPMLKFFKLVPEVRRVGALSFDDYWNDAFVEVFSQAANESGASVVASLKVNNFDPDFRPEIIRIKRIGVDALLSTWRPETVLRRLAEQKYHVPYLCSSDAVEAVLIRAHDRKLFEGMYFIDWRPSQDFITRFKAKTGKEPLFEAQNSYEAVRSIAKALESNPSDIRASLSQVVYEGVEGSIDFRNTHFPNLGQARLYRVEDGKFVEQ